MSNILVKERFSLQFESESEYSNYLAGYLQTVFGVVVKREVGAGTHGKRSGVADIHIPIVNAVVECKKYSRNRKQAFDQLARYGKLFDTQLLFFAASDNPGAVDEIVSALSTPIHSLRLLAIKKLEKTLKTLSKKEYPFDKKFSKLAHSKVVQSVDKALDEARYILGCNLKDKIRDQVKRLDDEWFKYCYIKGWYKPECSLDPSRFGDCWQHPSYKHIWVVKTKLNSFSSSCNGVAFYNSISCEIFFKDSCGTDNVSQRFEERKKSCQGLPCLFDNGFTIADDGVFLVSPIGRASSYKLSGESMLLAFLLHSDTRGYEDYVQASVKQFAKYGYMYDSVEDFLTNETIGKILTNYRAKHQLNVDNRQIELWIYQLSWYSRASRYSTPLNLIEDIVGKTVFEKYYSNNKTNFIPQ